MTNMQLTLSDYSNKYRVSISTLRRRIKRQDLEFTFDQGKYYILDRPLHEHSLPPRKEVQKDSAPPHKFNLSDEINVINERPKLKETTKVEERKTSHKESLQKAKIAKDEASFAETANNLLAELKKAYMLILSEKEEQVMYLKEEIADFKTLVRVLEEENKSLKLTNIDSMSSFDL